MKIKNALQDEWNYIYQNINLQGKMFIFIYKHPIISLDRE